MLLLHRVLLAPAASTQSKTRQGASAALPGLIPQAGLTTVHFAKLDLFPLHLFRRVPPARAASTRTLTRLHATTVKRPSFQTLVLPLVSSVTILVDTLLRLLEVVLVAIVARANSQMPPRTLAPNVLLESTLSAAPRSAHTALQISTMTRYLPLHANFVAPEAFQVLTS